MGLGAGPHFGWKTKGMMDTEQQTLEQAPVAAPMRDVTGTVLPIRFAQTSGAIVPTVTEQSTVRQMIYTPAQLLTVSGTYFEPVTE